MDFIKGMDISMLYEVEEAGGKFYDNNIEKDIYEILKSYDIDAIRLRLWVNPYDENGNRYGGGTNDLEKTISLAKRAKSNNMKFVLDIHYSDFWTDPEKQIKPKAWNNLSSEDLVKEVYSYTVKVLEALKSEDIEPDMIQVGNELTNGFLWPNGKFSNPEEMTNLLKAGIKGVKDVCNEKVKVILHLDNGGNNELYRNWFDMIEKMEVAYDIIGLSYYPYWHGTLQDLKNNLDDISNRYGKELLIMETSYGFTFNGYENGGPVFSDELASVTKYSVTEEGQGQFLKDLLETIKNVKDNKGKGFFYWEPAWIPIGDTTWGTKAGRKYIKNDGEGGNSWANQGLFDYEGNTLPSFKTIRDFK